MKKKIWLGCFGLFIALINFTGYAQEAVDEEKGFVRAAWIPYWRKAEGIDSVRKHLDVFDQISPFSFEVDKEGNLLDTLKYKDEPWPGLVNAALEKNILVLPSIVWTDAMAMQRVFNVPQQRQRHINNIIEKVEKYKLSGVDIDYENKDVSDKEAFSVFITELSSALKDRGCYLSCTIEARDSDAPPDNLNGTRAGAWANDLAVLNAACDSIRIMAYDQPFQENGDKDKWKDSSEALYAPNADIRWVEKSLKYFLTRLDHKKIILGIPTYGYEFLVDSTKYNWIYKRSRSLSYSQAAELARNVFTQPKRDETGELSFVYEKPKETFLVYYPDAKSISLEIGLARIYNIGGICLFKIDGYEDQAMWPILEAE